MRGVKSILLLLLALIIITSCTTVPEEKPVETVDDVKILMIIAQENFQDQEFSVPKQIFENKDFGVEVASLEKRLATSMTGAKVLPDLAVRTADAADYDAVVVVGGAGSPALAEDRDMLRFLQEADEKGKIVAAICFGPISLAKSGILEGRRATVYAEGTDYGVNILEENNVIYVNKRIIVDGNIVTANGPTLAEDFGEKIVSLVLE